MRKFIILIFAAAFCLFGCSSKDEATGDIQNTPSDSEESEMMEPEKETINQEPLSEETTEQNENTLTIPFVPSEDLEVIAAYTYDGDTYIVVENKSSQAILNYKAAYTNFDKNGFLTVNDPEGYMLGSAETVNLMPGEKDIAAWHGTTGDYAVAAVTQIDYADGSTWEASNISQWIETTKDEFKVENYKASIEKWKEVAGLAETNEYAVLVDPKIDHTNQFSSKHDLAFSLKNTSDQGITKINLFVLEFDDNGFPVAVSPYDTYCINGRILGGTVNLASGDSNSFSSSLFLAATCSKMKTAISYIEFQDGTDWTNPYIYEWILANNNAY